MKLSLRGPRGGSLLLRSGYILGYQGLGFLAGLLYGIATARALGPEGKGVLALLLTLYNMGSFLASLGLYQAIAYQVARAEIPPGRLVPTALILLALALAPVFTVILGLYGVLKGTAFQGLSPLLLGAALLMIGLDQVNFLLAGVAVGLNRAPEYFFWQFVGRASRAAGVVLLWLLNALTLYRVVGVILLFQFLLYSVGLYSSVRDYFHRMGGPKGWDPRVARKLLGYGLKDYLGGILQHGNYRMDYYLVNGFLGPGALGFYNVATGLAELLLHLPRSVAYALFPDVSSGRVQSRRQLFRIGGLTLLLAGAGGVVLALAAPFLVPFLYGEAFRPAVSPFLFLLPGALGLTWGMLAEVYLKGQGRPGLAAIATGIGFLFTVVFDLLLIPRFGVAGAAGASSLAYLAFAGVLTYLVLRRATPG